MDIIGKSQISTYNTLRYQQSLAIHKIDGAHHTEQRPEIIPAPLLAHVKKHKGHKDAKRDGLLHDFKLSQRKTCCAAQLIGRHHETIFKKGQSPAQQDKLPPCKRIFLTRLAQKSIPSKRHKNVADAQHRNR